jgi:beta-lactamase class D
MKSIFVLTLFLLLIASTSAQKQIDVKKYFDEQSVKGSFMMYDLNKDEYTFYDSARCFKQFIPASTYKIPNSIIGLETGVIADENFVIPWDSVKRPIEEWNHDLDLKTAIKVSCVPYYQELARRVGEERMKEMITRLGFGNMDISGGIDQFWLRGGLRISQNEQIDFLRRLYKGELPVSKRSMDITKSIILNEDTLGYKLRAKTGWGYVDEINIGWWVGWVETGGNVYFFATNVEARETGDNWTTARKIITRKILQELKILP